MQRVRTFGVIGVMVLLLLPARAATSLPPSPSSSTATAETRGLWVVRTTLASPDRIASMVRLAQQNGFNALFVQVRGRGDALYRSAIEPRSAELDGQPATFDPLARTIELAHKAGLRVHAWVAVNLVASSVTLPQDPHHIVRRHPEWLMLPAPLAKSLHAVAPTSPAYLESLAKWTRGESDQIEGLFLSPIPAASRQYTVSVVKDLVSHYAVDGIHFDYIRYPGEMFDYSAAALTEFRASTLKQVGASAQQRLDRQARVDPTAWAAALPDAWEKFRRDRLTALAHELATTARAARPHITVSSAVIPRADEARTRRLQDWPRWATTGVLDAVCPMAYVTDDTEFGNLVTRARSAAGHVPVWAGIGAFKLSPAEAARQVRVARESGAGGVVMFSYDSMTAESAAPNYLSQLRATLIARHP